MNDIYHHAEPLVSPGSCSSRWRYRCDVIVQRVEVGASQRQLRLLPVRPRYRRPRWGEQIILSVQVKLLNRFFTLLPYLLIHVLECPISLDPNHPYIAATIIWYHLLSFSAASTEIQSLSIFLHPLF